MKSRQFNKVKPYCYILTRILDGKKYFGLRYRNVKLRKTPKEDFGKFYFSSHKLFKKEFKKNPNNFKITLHATFDKIEESIKYEVKYNKTNTIKSKVWVNRAAYPQIQPTTKTKKLASQRQKGFGNSFYGKKHSSIFLEEKSESMKGKNNPMYGKTHTKKVKKLLANLSKGKKRSEESIAKQLNSRKGYRHSKKTKAKMSKSQSGKNHPFWGKKHSVKTKKKMSEWQLGKPKPWLKGRIPWNKK
jgi:hypothetical protein